MCLKEVSLEANESWESALDKHARAEHSMTCADMRRAILETVMYEGRQAIPAQVFRTVLHHFRTELSEEISRFSPMRVAFVLLQVKTCAA